MIEWIVKLVLAYVGGFLGMWLADMVGAFAEAIIRWIKRGDADV